MLFRNTVDLTQFSASPQHALTIKGDIFRVVQPIRVDLKLLDGYLHDSPILMTQKLDHR